MALKQVNSELELIYEYYKNLKQEIIDDPGREFEYDEYGNSQEVSQQLYYFLQDFYGKSNNPQILEDSEYEDLQAQTLYHGFRNMRFAANYLWDITKHYGGGLFGSGFYVSDDVNEAMEYTQVGFNLSRDRVVEMKVDFDNCKMIENYDLQNIIVRIKSGSDIKPVLYYSILGAEQKKRLCDLQKFLDNLNDRDFVDTITYDEAIIAIYLGFDAVVSNHERYINYLMLKPEKLCISQSEFERVMTSAGGKYKEYIDFWEGK